MSWDLSSIGYCSNVHPGKSFAEYLKQLKANSVQVRESLHLDRMGIGLWFSAATAIQLKSAIDYGRLIGFLDDNGLDAYTLNGFPYGDFHQDVVKHAVYLPTWASDKRLEYTKLLADLLSQLLVDQGLYKSGSISTLPLGWPDQDVDHSWMNMCADNLKVLARYLETIEAENRVTIRIAIEPEPGCVLQVGQQVIDFFNNYLLNGNENENQLVRRYIGVCHDVCHAAVMFEDQATLLDKLNDNQIGIYKLQVSSAIEARIVPSSESNTAAATSKKLAKFAEDRYLHQTSLFKPSGDISFYEDLPLALQALQMEQEEMTARVHYHVPIYMSEFDGLYSTQQQIIECLAWFEKNDADLDVEVETYAWSVLPTEMREPSLASGIAKELMWLQDQVHSG